MSKRTVYDCDRCGKEAADTQRIYYPTSWQRDVASGKSEDVSEDIDLCPACLRVELQECVKQLSYEQAQAEVKRIRGLFSKRKVGVA